MKKTENHQSTLHSSTSQEPGFFFKKETEEDRFSESNQEENTFFSSADEPNEVSFFSSSLIQPKLEIGQPDDQYEQEAEATANQVVQTLTQKEGVQRKCAACKEEEIAPKIQTKSIFESNDEAADASLQRKCVACQTSDIAPKPATAKTTGIHLQESSDLESRLHSTKGGGSPLSKETQGSMETTFGTDFRGVRVHTDNSSVQMNQELGAQAFTHGSDIYFNSGKYDPGSRGGQHLLAHELTHVVQQGASLRTRIIQRNPDGEQENHTGSKVSIPIQVPVDKLMSREAFIRLYLKEEYGIEGGHADEIIEKDKQSTPDKRRFSGDWTVTEKDLQRGHVIIHKVKQVRDVIANIENPDMVEPRLPNGKRQGYGGREALFDGYPSGIKKLLTEETDRRYWEKTGYSPGEKIKSGEKGKAEIWLDLRDEVIAQHEFIKKLPEKVKQLIKFKTGGKEITPQDYEQFYRIAKKIEEIGGVEVQDYYDRITGSTTDLEEFESSVDRYKEEQKERKEEEEKRKSIQTKLFGLDELYEEYKEYKKKEIKSYGYYNAKTDSWEEALPSTIAEYETAKRQLTESLEAHGFTGGIPEFKQYIDDFKSVFKKEAQKIALDILAKCEGFLYRESERYKESGAVNQLHSQLEGFRGHSETFKKNADISNDYAENYERSRLPGNGHLRPKATKQEAEEAYEKASIAKAAAQAEVEAISEEHTLFKEGDIPLDKRIDKEKMAQSSPEELGQLIQDYITARIEDIQEARARILEDEELVFKLDKLMPKFYTRMEISQGSLTDKIVKDEIDRIERAETLINVLLTILAVALAILSYGTATPFIATAAAVGGFGISAYMAYDEYQKYAVQNDLADVGFADDPSMFWLIVAVAGAALDMGAAVKAMRALGPAAKIFNSGGDVAEFSKALKAVQEAGEIDVKIVAAAEKAALAKKGYQEASEGFLRTISSKAYSFPGPLTDPDVYKELVKMAYFKAKQGVRSFQQFFLEIQKMRKLANQGDMTAEELANLKKAYEEGNQTLRVVNKMGGKLSSEANSILSKVGSPVHPNVPSYTGGKTKGVFKNGKLEVPLESGETGPGKWIFDNLPGGPGSGKTRAWTHVEGHAAGIMHKHGIKEAELFINQRPCKLGAAKCQFVISKLLPPDGKLAVHFLKEDGISVGIGIFESGVPGFKIIQ